MGRFPAETKGLVVTCLDPGLPTGGGFWHWMLVNVPLGTTMRHTKAGAGQCAGDSVPSTSFQVRNDFNDRLIRPSTVVGPSVAVRLSNVIRSLFHREENASTHR